MQSLLIQKISLFLKCFSQLFQVIYEALNGHKVGWKKALHSLNERFSNVAKCSKEENRPCILLIDELDLLVTRNQAVNDASFIHHSKYQKQQIAYV